MPYLRIYDIFIAHVWDYNDDYHRLVGLLDNAANFSWRNYSVPEHDPLGGGSDARLRAEIDKQIRPVHVVLALSGVYASHRDWIQEELTMASAYGKPIVGLYPWGNQRGSAVVQRHAVEMVNWSTVSIVDAIRRHAL
jgi:hypothetical protein